MHCATPDCGEALIKIKGKEIECSQCKKHTCSDCKAKSHKGMTCAQNQDKSLGQWAGQKGVALHKCPNCETLIEKNGGCPHMYCFNCQYSFCWSCGRSDTTILHEKLGGVFFCAMFNAIFFEMGKELHPVLKFIAQLLIVIGVALGPFLLVIFGVLYAVIAAIYICILFIVLLFSPQKWRRLPKLKECGLIILAGLGLVILLPIAACVYVLMTGIYYIMLCGYTLYFLLFWTCGSKKPKRRRQEVYEE